MDKDKVKKDVEDTLACTAFAEAGEPCPIGSEEQAVGATPTETTQAQEEKNKHKKSVMGVVEDDFACTAFAESGEPCPIGGEEQAADSTTTETTQAKKE